MQNPNIHHFELPSCWPRNLFLLKACASLFSLAEILKIKEVYYECCCFWDALWTSARFLFPDVAQIQGKWFGSPGTWPVCFPCLLHLFQVVCYSNEHLDKTIVFLCSMHLSLLSVHLIVDTNLTFSLLNLQTFPAVFIDVNGKIWITSLNNVLSSRNLSKLSLKDQSGYILSSPRLGSGRRCIRLWTWTTWPKSWIRLMVWVAVLLKFPTCIHFRQHKRLTGKNSVHLLLLLRVFGREKEADECKKSFEELSVKIYVHGYSFQERLAFRSLFIKSICSRLRGVSCVFVRLSP